jgi:hypothetical protein
MSTDPRDCYSDHLMGERAEADHYDKVREYEEFVDSQMERISELLKLKTLNPEVTTEGMDAWGDEQDHRLDVIEDCIQKLEDLNKQYQAGGIAKGKSYEPRYERLIKDIRNYLGKNPHVSFSAALIECAEKIEDISVSAAQKHIKKSDVMTPELEILIRETKSS